MSASILERPGRLLVAPALALLLAGCGSGGGTGQPDTRCFGVAQVAGWSIHVVAAFADTGSTDTAQVALHATLDGTGTAGPVQSSSTNTDGFGWFSGRPTGTFAAADTVVFGAAHDTVVGTSSAFGKGPVKNYGPYVSVNLATCQASVGALLYSVVSQKESGHAAVLDTIFAAYPYFSGITIDSQAVADGWTVTSGKFHAVLPDAPFVATGGEYRAGGLVGPYTTFGSATLDSATVSFTVTPLASLAAPGTPFPEGATLLPNGILVPPRR